ncbi:MAG: riboflavin biosynthesis protein RibD, partial [Arcobacter sp.]|nr:riboflavin biosynthesis protein RibD [Arcobacter sp.]
NKIFDNNIPLFKIPNRNVIISDDLFKLLDYKFVMIEGVYTLLDKLKERIDFFILIVNSKIKNGQNALNDIDINFEILHENFIGDDKIMFLKRK